MSRRTHDRQRVERGTVRRKSLARQGRRARRARPALALTVVLVALLALAACTDDRVTRTDAADPTSGGVAAESAEPEEAPADAEGAEPDVSAEDRDRTLADSIGALADADGARMLVREGTVTLRYPDSFDAAYTQVADIAGALGGAVSGVSSEEVSGEVTGSVTVEVPVERYDELLARIAEVGDVIRRDVHTEEVTEEHVDLSSRLRHLERQEAFYLELFEEAEGVEDALSIQRHLEEVQQRKEQVQGRLDQLERMAATSSLRVELVGEGVDAGTADPRDGFGAYWDEAVDAFVRVAGTMLVIAVGAAPLALAGGAIVAVILLAVRVWRGAAVAS